MRTKRATGVALAGVLILLVGVGPAARGQAGDRVTLTEKAFTESQRVQRVSGIVVQGEQQESETHSEALRIAVGDQALALSAGESTLSFSRTFERSVAPSLDRALFIPCDDPSGVALEGSTQCLDADVLAERGFDVGGNDRIAVESLVQAGIAQLDPISETDELGDLGVSSSAAGLLLPGAGGAQGDAACDTETTEDSGLGGSLPEGLEPVITGDIGIASCQTSSDRFPFAKHASGEANLAVTLTQTLVDDDRLSQGLDEIQAGLGQLPAELSDPVNNVIDAIRAELSAHPLATIDVAPNSGELVASEEGIVGTAGAVAVDLNVLGGILEIQIGTADTQASILNETPAASASAGNVTVCVKALNILQPGEDPIIDRCLEQDLTTGEPVTILEGTPLQTTIGVLSATEKAPSCEVGGDGIKTCQASAQAAALSLSLLEGEQLPTISVDLAGAGTQVVASFETANTQSFLPLARTGAANLPTIFAGSGLIALAALVRRRFGR